MASEAETEAMKRAIDLSSRGLGSTSPNPVVGAVLINPRGETIGEGFHERAGGPHAEVRALLAAGEAARGATMVVTLEPCDTTGRTQPCTEALVAAGVRKVVYAVADPTDAGGGTARLAAAGIEVLTDVLAPDAARVNEAWLHAMSQRRPFVVWKSATSLDGRVAATDGSSRWITGVEARADAHRLRSELDAIVVGSGTVLTDDPQLTARDARGRSVELQPLRVVVDRRGRVPVTAKVLDDAGPSLVIDAEEPAEVLDVLFDRGVRSLLLEGGPVLVAAFMAAGLVDKVVTYIAPALLGEGPAALAPFGVNSIEAVRRFRVDDVQMVGGDVRITSYPLKEDPRVHGPR